MTQKSFLSDKLDVNNYTIFEHLLFTQTIYASLRMSPFCLQFLHFWHKTILCIFVLNIHWIDVCSI